MSTRGLYAVPCIDRMPVKELAEMTKSDKLMIIVVFPMAFVIVLVTLYSGVFGTW